jgi:uncharacterized Zn finger protein
MAFKTPILPRISKFTLFGYQPLFDKPIEASVEKNRLLVLGGNGLGKTTILQSIIYCIAGEADLDIEANKDKRWGRKYFYGRIERPEDAYVQVDFFLGDDKITIKRGFKTARILEFKLNDLDLLNDSGKAIDLENYLIQSIGYHSANDFRFLVHKLCYLPEDRANLVWDSENQIRLMMLLFGDIIDERDFRERRAQLKMLDSQKRHINVDLNSARSKLSTSTQALSAQGNEQVNSKEVDVNANIEVEEDANTETTLLQKLNQISENKFSFVAQTKEIKKDLTALTEEVETIQDKLFDKEETYILEKLDQLQSDEVRLALHKLLHRQICPACGEKAEELAKQAQSYQTDGRCPLCGSKKSVNVLENETYPLLEAQLSEKVRLKISLEQNLFEKEKQLQLLEDEESNLQFKYNEIKLREFNRDKSANVEEIESNVGNISTEMNLETRVHQFELAYLESEKRFQDLKGELEKRYEDFTKIANERVVRLGQLYEAYATSFLGTQCELDKRNADIKFLSLDLYVPKFNNQIRPLPESCSEAQRFFLDIAFRMSVIDLAKELSGSKGSFVCETPENALDVTYIQNVADMFKDFAQEGHALIASGNLQPAGLAGPILFDIPKKSRAASVLNLLNYGKLSDVQEHNRSALEAVYHENVIAFRG